MKSTGTTVYQQGLTDLLTKICIFNEGSGDVKLKINRMLLCHMWTPDDSAADMDIGAKTRQMATGSFSYERKCNFYKTSKYLDPTKEFWNILTILPSIFTSPQF